MDKAVNKLFSPDEVRKWHSAFKREGELFEIRLLGDKVYSGYFNDVEAAIQAIAPFDQQQVYQIYFSVNEVNPACSSRKQYNRFLIVKGSATSKNDIEHRWMLPIDIDVKRPSDISSTDEEKQYAYKKACDVYLFLQENGFPSPIVCDSSSGYHLYYPIDLDNNSETERLVYSVFDVLGARFTDDRVKIDRQVGDANRIMRLPGSWGRKGRDSEERPHRLAQILAKPDVINRANAEFIKAFTEKYKVEEERPAVRQWNGTLEQFDLRDFIRDNNIRVRNETSWGNGGTKFVLEECPFDSSHKAPDSAIFLSANGAIGFKCFHDSCSGHTWHELRQMLDPNAYQPKTFNSVDATARHRQVVPQIPVVEIKQESNELGKKWLDLHDDVEDVNLDDIGRIDTGFIEINEILGGGLFDGETTILSGINGSGKSAFLNTLLLNAIQAGAKSALWTGELPATRLKRWLIQAAAGEHLTASTRSYGKFYVNRYYTEKISSWLSGKFLLRNNNYPSNPDQLIADMEELLKLGFKLFVLDNLFSMELSERDGSEISQQKRLILSIANFAKKNKVHCILVAHPRKVVSFLRKEDILGSSALQNAVDNIAIIHRYGNDFEKRIAEYLPSYRGVFKGYGNVIEFCKNREFGAIERLVGIYYNLNSKHFYDKQGEFRYGWEITGQDQAITFEPESPKSDLPFTGENEDELPF